MKHQISRRQFVSTGAAVGVGFWAAGGVAPKVSKAANETINFACVGVGGKGSSDSDDCARHGNIVAICDIDEDTLNKAGQKPAFTKAEKFHDFRKMFDKLGKSIDAVTVSTPDHCHAVAAAMAMNLGKHCFCQKPLTRTIYEARRLGEIAKEKKVATQMGNQGTANTGVRRAAAMIKAGVIGQVKEVHVWTNRPIWPQGEERPKEEVPVPTGIHWDEFIGPAEFRPYSPLYHPFKWRGWWAFGTGALGDMACHTFNMPFMALDLRNPTSVQATTSGHNGETYPKWSRITFDFAANDARPGLKFYWYDGGQLPSADFFRGATLKRAASGCLIVGDEGIIHSPDDYGARFEIIGDAKEIEVEYERSPGHFEEWVAAIKGGPAAKSNFSEYAGPLTETILLGNLAVWVANKPEEAGKLVEWDAVKLKATNAPETDNIVKTEYRAGYSL